MNSSISSSEQSETPAGRASWRFLVAFVASGLVMVVVLAGLLLGLDATGRLKAPAIANRASFDEKLRQLRHSAVDAPRTLLAGSSTTLHGLDGELLGSLLGDGDAINVGVQDLKIDQIRYLAAFMLERHPSIERVIMVSTMLDFELCSPAETAFFDREHAETYLSGEASELFTQLKHLDPKGIVQRIGDIQARRASNDSLDSLAFGARGSLLLDVPRDRIDPRVWEGKKILLDERCYSELTALADELDAADIDFVYVIAPMRPGYLAFRDPGGSLETLHRQHLDVALARADLVIDAHSTFAYEDEVFFDAYHVRPDQAREMTRMVARRFGQQSHHTVAHETSRGEIARSD